MANAEETIFVKLARQFLRRKLGPFSLSPSGEMKRLGDEYMSLLDVKIFVFNVNNKPMNEIGTYKSIKEINLILLGIVCVCVCMNCICLLM